MITMPLCCCTPLQLPQQDWFLDENSDFLRLFSSFTPHSPPSTRTHLRARQPAEWISTQKVEALLKSQLFSAHWQQASELNIISWGFLNCLQSCSPGWRETRMRCICSNGGVEVWRLTSKHHTNTFALSPRTEMCRFTWTKIDTHWLSG